MLNKHKELKLKYGYKIASIVTESILEHDEEIVNEHSWLTGVCSDDYFESLIIENKNKILNPNKETLLHIFIGDMLDSYFYGEVYTFRDNHYCDFDMGSIIDFFENTFACILREYDKPIKNFSDEIEKIDKKFDKERISEDDYEKKLEEYIEYFNNKLDTIKHNIIEEVFYLLFANKRLIMEFNRILASYMSNLDKEEHSEIFDEHGNVKRCNSLPEWLKKAVFFKCNGICQKCGKDLSNTFRVNEERELHYDHIIPLEKGGANDPTNFQILCQSCNSHKSASIEYQRNYYQSYW